ncbi:hypothetical protein, partial [Rhodovulum adriaticum]|uniref:hypothetical protein n=1 Tax=Rhodovulum adriaticum TaxID=35804 RepID=UPI001905FE80
VVEGLDFISEISKLSDYKKDYSNKVMDGKSLSILNALEGKILNVDELSIVSKIPINELYSIIFSLESQGYIVNIRNNLYTLA